MEKETEEKKESKPDDVAEILAMDKIVITDKTVNKILRNQRG